MRILIQRVKAAKVILEGQAIAEIGKGLLLLAGIGKNDNKDDIELLARKVMNLRIFEDEMGKMNLLNRQSNSAISHSRLSGIYWFI
ncbi:MAG: D-aminoacyl-tRNA deacylase [Nitrospirae bacterium]|nr:D-aminoacyl-tRNA deacylase [Nitrospirota bacterium]